MDFILEIAEEENCSLNERVADLEAEKNKFAQQVTLLEKCLLKEKAFHRKFAETVIESERLGIEDFKKQKRSLTDENKSLLQKNRQLTIDVSFYQKAHNELTREEEVANYSRSNRKLSVVSNELATEGEAPSENKYEQRSVNTSASELASTSELPSIIQTDRKSNRSLKVLSKVSEKLFLENKKLKMKVANLNNTIGNFKKQCQRLENFKNKMESKKLKFSKELDEIELLADSTRIKNKHTFTPEVLGKLRQLVC